MFFRKKKQIKLLYKKNCDLRERNTQLDRDVYRLEGEVSAYKRKIERSDINVLSITKIVRELCADPRFDSDKLDSHPAAMLLVQQTRAYYDMLMFRGHMGEFPSTSSTSKEADRHPEDDESAQQAAKQRRENDAAERIYGKDALFWPPRQTDGFNPEEFVKFSQEEYKSLKGTPAANPERIAIEPGFDAICNIDLWNYKRLAGEDGVEKAINNQWKRTRNTKYYFYWPFCLIYRESAGNHCTAAAWLYHKPFLVSGETEMYADVYVDYRESEIFHRITSDGIYWLKDGKPYCVVWSEQRAIIWMILHTIMEEKQHPIKYKGVPLNKIR